MGKIEFKIFKREGKQTYYIVAYKYSRFDAWKLVNDRFKTVKSANDYILAHSE